MDPQMRGSDIRREGSLTGGKSLLQKTTKTQPFQIEITYWRWKISKNKF